MGGNFDTEKHIPVFAEDHPRAHFHVVSRAALWIRGRVGPNVNARPTALTTGADKRPWEGTGFPHHLAMMRNQGMRRPPSRLQLAPTAPATPLSTCPLLHIHHQDPKQPTPLRKDTHACEGGEREVGGGREKRIPRTNYLDKKPPCEPALAVPSPGSPASERAGVVPPTPASRPRGIAVGLRTGQRRGALSFRDCGWHS